MKIDRIIKASALLLAMTAAVAAAGCQKEESSSKKESAPTASSSQAETSSETSKDKSSDAAASSKPEESSEEASKSNIPEEESGPIPEISDPTPDSDGETVNGIFIYDNKSYEMFYGYKDLAEEYSKAISTVKKDLGSGIKVYNVLVPTHVAIDLPSKFDDMCSDQNEYINDIINAYTEDITPVSTYNKLKHHCNEYLYFNTDHHWTALGAYYAYQEFARVAGIDAVQLSDLKEGRIEGYQGSLAAISGVETLKDDYVTYYTSDKDIDTTLYDGDGTNPRDYSLIHSYAEGANAYGVFLGGDTPILTTKNKQGNGKKIAVIKESYGNAFSPFIAYTYSEAHFIDFRYVSINLKSYLEQNGIDEVIFINNTMATATPARCEEMIGLASGIAYTADNTADEEASEDNTAENDTEEEDTTDNDTAAPDTYDEGTDGDTDEGAADYTDDNTEGYTGTDDAEGYTGTDDAEGYTGTDDAEGYTGTEDNTGDYEDDNGDNEETNDTNVEE